MCTSRCTQRNHHDRGGNCIGLALPHGQAANLHSYWDVDVVEALGGSPEQIADRLDVRPPHPWRETGPKVTPGTGRWNRSNLAGVMRTPCRLGRPAPGGGLVALSQEICSPGPRGCRDAIAQGRHSHGGGTQRGTGTLAFRGRAFIEFPDSRRYARFRRPARRLRAHDEAIVEAHPRCGPVDDLRRQYRNCFAANSRSARGCAAPCHSATFDAAASIYRDRDCAKNSCHRRAKDSMFRFFSMMNARFFV